MMLGTSFGIRLVFWMRFSDREWRGSSEKEGRYLG